MGDDGESLAILPRSMGQTKPGAEHKKVDPKKFIPAEKGGVLTTNPIEEESPYSFSDSPYYVAKKKYEEQTKRAAELEGKDETRGFLKSVEDLGKKHKWEEALQQMDRRTAVPSGLFLVTRAVLRWKFGRYHGALRDLDEAMKNYASSAKAGPLAAAFSSFARICIGSTVCDRGSCSKEMKELVLAWEEAEERTLRNHALGKGLFHPREETRLTEPCEVVEGMEAQDFSYVAATGVKIGYVLLKNTKDVNAPLVVHFHGSNETAADYRKPALAEKYRDLPVHLLVVDYRGYGWSNGEPSLATFLRDAEPLAEKLPEMLVQNGFAWPYPSGLILSGRSLGAQVAVHMAAMYPSLFRGLILDSSVATSATGDRLGRAPERNAAMECWRKELRGASLEVLQSLDESFWCLSALDKIRSYEGQLLLLHGLADEIVPYESSESLHVAAKTRHKEMVLIEDAGHNNIGRFEKYWASQKRFASKLTLEDSLPKVGEVVEHLCAICAEKAVSKCGRCMKVWYCGRKHQAEHWKSHKMTCAGGPPEPKVKVEPEAEACVVAAVVAEICDDQGVIALKNSLASAASQEEPLQTLCVGWHAASQALAERIVQAIEELKSKHQALNVVSVESQSELSRFQHIKALLDAIAQEAPAHSWVAFLEAGSVWSARHTATIMLPLRRAAADARVIAATCSRRAQAKDSEVPSFETAEEVEAAITAGKVELGEDKSAELPLPSLLVRIKTLQAFLEATPAPALAHELCAHRLQHRLQTTFGKKIQALALPEDAWMRWDSSVAVASPEASLNAITALDKDRGNELFTGMQKTLGSEAPSAEGDDAPQDLAKAKFGDTEEAARAMAGLRRAIERKFIQVAGEKVSAKDMKAQAMEQVNEFLEAQDLHTLLGIQRWARAACAELSEASARQFTVEVA